MSLAWYPFYVGDYARDTADLSCLEHGCFRLLLDAFWARGPLPNDLNRLCRLAAGCDAETVREVLERYWQLNSDGLWINQRMEDVILIQQTAHEKRQNAGRSGGRKKASNAKAMLKQCSSTQNQNQNQKEEIDISCAPAAHTPDLMAGFADWWEAYGKKVNRKKCVTKWKSAKLHTKAEQLIEDAQRRHKEDAQWRDGFQPHPLTYLNGERWEDEISKTRENGNAAHNNNTARPESAHERRKRINQEIRDRAMSHFSEVG